MIDAGAIQELYNALAAPKVPMIDGKERLILPSGWVDATPDLHAVAPLAVNTLTAVVDYLRANRDGLTLDQILVHVVGPDHVEVRAPLEDEEAHYRRHTYLKATTAMVGGASSRFGQFLDAESFVIGLQVGFVSTTERDSIIRFVSAIKESNVRETVDDGYAQQVNTAGGITLVGTQRVPNPVSLAPYRTFREVEQPASTFVLRLKSNDKGDKPLIALFEADGGVWKLTAVDLVAEFLKANLPDGVTVLG